MSKIGITAYGAYIPRMRLERAAIAAAHAWSMPSLKGLAKGARAVANWDEDSVTMSVEAVRACLKTAPAMDNATLTFASTTPVFDDFQNASMVSLASGIGKQVSVLDACGSIRAGTSALSRQLTSGQAGMVVAADHRQAKPASVQEMQYGAGSIAMSVGEDSVIARYLGSASTAEMFVDHFRKADRKTDYVWEDRWIRDEGYMKQIPAVVGDVLKKSGIEAGDVTHFVMPAGNSRVAPSVAKRCGINPEAAVDNLAAQCGDTGAPQPLLMLALALEQAAPGDRILVVSFGAGCDAILLEATEALADYQSAATVTSALESGSQDGHYTKLLSYQEQIVLDWGMRAESDTKVAMTQLYRSQDQLVSFDGGKCADCGTIQFPVLATCVNCGSMETMSAVNLADKPAKVATYTADWLQFTPSPPFYYGLVQFDNGARILMEMVDVNPETFDIGAELRMVYRVKQRENMRGFHRYFWKATPV